MPSQIILYKIRYKEYYLIQFITFLINLYEIKLDENPLSSFFFSKAKLKAMEFDRNVLQVWHKKRRNTKL